MMGRAVVDASALVSILLAGPSGSAADASLEERELHVPAICDVEVMSALVRAERNGALGQDELLELVMDLVTMPLTRHLHVAAMGRMFELRRNLTAADASYVALAEALDATLVTVDGPLRRAVKRHTEVPVVP